jgi:hypothetical protein
VEAAGYKVAFSLQQTARNYAHTHPLLLDRIGVVGQEPHSLFHARMSGVYSMTRALMSPARHTLRIHRVLPATRH